MKPRDLMARFAEKFSPDSATGCWLWTDHLDRGGYGKITTGSRTDGSLRSQSSHRVAWLLFRGDVPTGGHVLHLCDTPRCVNPDHLFIGDYEVNNRDRAKKRRSARGSSSFPLGVSRQNSRVGARQFQARITFKGKRHYLGYFETAAEAGVAVEELMEKLHGI